MMSGFNYETRMDLIQRYIDQGKAFRTFEEITVPGNGSYDMSVKIGSDAVGLYYRLLTTSEPNIRYEVRSGASFTSYGDPVTIFNINGKSSEVSKNIFRPCTVSEVGTLTDIDLVPGVEGFSFSRSGQVYGGIDDIKIIKEDTETLLRFINPNSDAAEVLIYLRWLEIPAGIWG